MRERPPRTRLEAHEVAVLPADGATLGRGLSRRLILVAHTGRAHLGITVDRGLARELARARAAVRPVPRREGEPLRPVTPAGPEIYFRHATAGTVTVSRGEVFLTLYATGEPGKPDVQVELRVDRPLLDRLVRRRRR